MDCMQLSLLNVDNQFDWLYSEEQPLGEIEQQSTFNDSIENCLNSLLEHDPNLLPVQNNHILQFYSNGFEDIGLDFESWNTNFPSFYDDTGIDAKPLNTMTPNFDQWNNVSSVSIEVQAAMHERELKSEGKNKKRKRENRKSKSCALELDEIQKYFGVPITEAAKELNVGLTVLKKRCRELNIMRWPHRKIRSLKFLIDNVKELGFTDEIVLLEEHKRMVEKLPELELTERTKRLRQACFKANYKKRRSLAVFA